MGVPVSRATAELYTPSVGEAKEAWIATYARAGELTREAILRGQSEFGRLLAGVEREAAAKALEDAADAIRVEAGADEMALHLVTYEGALPVLSGVMLNGVTRAAERLRARAAEVREARP